MASACLLSPNGGDSSRGERIADTLFVATIRGVYRLKRKHSDGPWEIDAKALEDRHISALLWEPSSRLLFAGFHGRAEDGGLFCSADYGVTWEPRMTGLKNGHVYTLAAQDCPGGVVLYAGTEPPALYRSDDLGLTWTDLRSISDVPDTDKWTSPPPPHIAHVKHVAFHPAQPETLYVCIEQGALLKSVDGGKTWAWLKGYTSSADTFYHDAHRVAIESGNPERLYMATGDGLYRTEDGGETWRHLQGRKDRVGYPDALFIDPRNDDVVYMGGAHDAPLTWRKLGGAFPGFIVSRDRGQSWSELMEGMPNPVHGNIEAMGMHVWPEGIGFFAGTAVGEVFASEDGGQHWVRIAQDLPPISKYMHYRHFQSADEAVRIENEARRA